MEKRFYLYDEDILYREEKEDYQEDEDFYDRNYDEGHDLYD